MEYLIKKENNRFCLLKDEKILIDSENTINPVHEDCNVFMIWDNPYEFKLYSSIKQKFILSGRQFYKITEYSDKDKSFAAWCHLNEGDRCYLIFNDGAYCENSAFEISDERYNHRIFKLGHKKWHYYDCQKRKFLWDVHNGYTTELGHRFLNYGSFVDKYIRKRYLWYYDLNEKDKTHNTHDTYLYLFKQTISDDFEEIPGTKYFAGISWTQKGSVREKRHIRLFHIDTFHAISRSSEIFEDYHYISQLNCFQVRTKYGWTLVKFDSEENDFIRVHCPLYDTKFEVRIYDDVVFIKKKEDNWDFYVKDDEPISNIWKRIILKEGKAPYVIATDFSDKTKEIPLVNLKSEYFKVKCKILSEINADSPQNINLQSEGGDNPQTTLQQTKEPLMKDNIENVKYYSFGCITESSNNYMGSDKITRPYKLEKNDLIAWIDPRSQSLFLLRYVVDRTYKKIQQYSIPTDIYGQIAEYHEVRFKAFENPCTPDNVLNSLLEISYKIKKKKENISKKHNLDEVIRDTYKFLLDNSDKNLVEAAVYLLFKDRINELRNLSEDIDEKINAIDPEIKQDAIITEEFIENFIGSVPEEDKQYLKIGYDYHRVCEKLSPRQSLVLVCEQKNMLDLLQQKIDEASIILKEQSAKYVEKRIHELFEFISTGKVSDDLDNKDKDFIPELSILPHDRFPFQNNSINKYDFTPGEKIQLSDLNANSRDFQRKEGAIFIFLDHPTIQKIDTGEGIYRLPGEGKPANGNQTMGQNANGDIANNLKRILIFEKIESHTCLFFDEVRCISYEEKNDFHSNKNRSIIEFKLKSLRRYAGL